MIEKSVSQPTDAFVLRCSWHLTHNAEYQPQNQDFFEKRSDFLVLGAPFSLMALFDDASIIEADKLVFGVENQVESIV